MEYNDINVIILVVLYDKDICDSSTITSLLEGGVENVKLVIHNNGPRSVTISDGLVKEFKAKNVETILINHIKNKPLSVLYNDFITENISFERYCILDDDTYVTSSYIATLHEMKHDLEVPLIKNKSEEIFYYPVSNNRVVTKYGVLDPNSTISIGSGLIISNEFVRKYAIYDFRIFDESYAFYGVDFSLFRRLKKISKSGVHFQLRATSTLAHELSRTEKKFSQFRRSERIIDFAITVRKYPSSKLFFEFFARTILYSCSFRWSDLSLLIKTLVDGIHPRCKNVEH